MAGLTPFQFSSKLMQEQTTSGLLGGTLSSIGGSAVSGLMGAAFAWYEMWINPEKVDIQTSYIQKKQHTAGSIVTYHYRQETPTMSVSGVCGWIMQQSEREEMGGRQDMFNPRSWAYKPNMRERVNHFATRREFLLSGQQRAKRLGSNNSDNSPRIFLKRLKALADQPMYYIDAQGIEHYNIKYIKIFTKQFPDGVVCEGYFTRFNVPEESSDHQTINYNFEFIIEKMTPISFFDKQLGMFGMTGLGSKIGSTLRSGL